MSQENHSFNAKTSTKKSNFLKVIDILFVIVFIFFILYVFVFNRIESLKWIVGVLILISVFIYTIIFIYSKNKAIEATSKEIEKLILLKDSSLGKKEWIIKGKTSVLIGKKSVNEDVYINLTGTEYESLINNQHAALNYVSGVWYVEDLDSFNGVGIKKAGKGGTQKLESGEPFPIHSGDILYIANTRLLVK